MTACASDELLRFLRRLDGWLRREAFPFWARHGVDWELGGFHERIDADCRPTNDLRRTRLVARQIYAFTQAARFGWIEDADKIVDHGLDFMIRRCVCEDGVVRIAVAADGGAIKSGFDLYDYAFALFALAEVHRSRPHDRRAGELAARIADSLGRGWKHPLGGFERACPRVLPLEANPNMHLLEAFLAWMEAAPADPMWKARAADIVALALERLIDRQTGVIREYWNGDWTPTPGSQGRIVEPGHQFEWAWLLLRWDALTDSPQAVRAAGRLAEVGEAHGVDPVAGLAIAELWDDMTVRDDCLRLWPQTERLKAHLQLAARAKSGAERNLLEKRAVAASRGFEPFLSHQVSGLWRDVVPRSEEPCPPPTKASSLYHIVCAFTELDAYANRFSTALNHG